MPNLYVRLTNDQLDILQACVGMGAAMAYTVGQNRNFPFLSKVARELDEVIRDPVIGDIGNNDDTASSDYPIVQQVKGKDSV